MTAPDREREARDTELASARDTIRALNRRCQAAEAAVGITIEDCKRQGVSLGRALANAGYAKLEAENAELRAQIADLSDTLDLAQQEAPRVESNISAERDGAWRAAIEGMRDSMNEEIIAAIDDPRHFKDERSGLRMARIIADKHCAALAALAERMGT